MKQHGWYPANIDKLDDVMLEVIHRKKKNINGVIVPHAGYFFSGEIAGKAYSFLEGEKAIIFGPTHYVGFKGLASLHSIKTPYGEIKIKRNDMEKLEYEHSIENQVPFLQKLGFNEVFPIVVGEITDEEAKNIAKNISKEEGKFVFSTDLSHFLSYEKAVEEDKKTIEIIQNLDFSKINEINACGKYPLMILMHLCKFKNWKPELVEYKNSGDITGKKDSVVGYASFWF
ncbi:AmmeMemoRadiSam system protein B [Candidatus Woesearchaeota archaeon]|nr:AmmeMemoRadiSam system protein B [Candidatus Woesearchaeota archaeon]